ncbi:MAG: DUF6285 domain-containing protein [Anaerolineae bacterium]|nr:DUF6285 domain-containing protein [Anaerolineae bacterium]
MYDRPTTPELLDAVRKYLSEQIIPVVRNDRKLNYQTHIAINLLRIVERQMSIGTGQVRDEWLRLNHVQGTTNLPPTDSAEALTALSERNRKLCQEISAGRYDYMPQRAALYEHLLATVRVQLEVANPDFLEVLAKEDAKKQL